jgi:hypothetical protein
MIQPGSAGWINKYFDLVDKQVIQLEVNRPEELGIEHFLHLTFGHTGIIFGYPNSLIFAKNLDTSKWTVEENLKMLLFESHLLVFLLKNEDLNNIKEDFINSLLSFYGKHNSYSITKIFTFFLKESNVEKLENILVKRLEIKMKLLDNKLWVNYLSNVFVYLDVILFYDNLKGKKRGDFSNYSELAMNSLTAITISAFSDGVVEEKEQAMFDIFLASANLPEKKRDLMLKQLKTGATVDDLSPSIQRNWLFKRFILDVSALTILANLESVPEEKLFLTSFCEFLKIPEKELDETLVMVGSFVLNNNQKVSFLKTSSSYEKMFSSFSRRWIKVLGRNKDKLATELKQSKELVSLIKKSTMKELSKEEKEIVKTQFMDIVKSMPALAIFMLPGGALLLPLVLKVLPDLLPSAFRDNEIDNEKK